MFKLKKKGLYGIKNVHDDDTIPAIIADNTSAPIPVRAPFLKVNIRAKTIIITNQIPRATLTNATNPSITIFCISDKNENAVLIINSGTEYPTALTTWLNDSASPLIAFPM